MERSPIYGTARNADGSFFWLGWHDVEVDGGRAQKDDWRRRRRTIGCSRDMELPFTAGRSQAAMSLSLLFCAAVSASVPDESWMNAGI
ncbi:hypothetical protein MPTK1_4g04340 [Marchantia polymorpha subsp. ruderalis]|uniref:Uncharacterized protein n=2 Tax=Marchantia polymorpha TaxID=3197 RepID=A0AAF6B6A0_MARPO|nr:hypothetical protein MARPO_0044s0039 [Marchantia polymorpha]BBN07534.1 hypothetical protein Mp_4g04340 [Marchantia polymorpha subsp. ruderalis]|eukprot:PTQ39566.1 hypothetical protein MARPO_0044s0039 [Marchantia polymorpha]